ncbi:MAG: hypothetical protein ACRECT_03820 [Thermoplasmata archaeon]
MVLRETTFAIGGCLMIGLGIALAAGLAWARAGWIYYDAWLGAGIAVGLGVFFLRVGHSEGEVRREELRRLEGGEGSSPGRPPP